VSDNRQYTEEELEELLEQVAISKRLQMKVLKRFEALLDDGAISDTGLATLVRLLQGSGWTVDAMAIPKRLRGVLTKTIDASKYDKEDADVERGGGVN
jgi:hypothetical protein